MRVPSSFAQQQLSQLLLDRVGWGKQSLETFLRSNGYASVANQIDFDGPPSDVFPRAIGSLAGKGTLNSAFFDLLATDPSLVEWGDEITALRVEFEINDPPVTHFDAETLEKVLVAAERADLNSGSRYAALVTRTSPDLRLHSSGPQLAEPAWVRSLFTAANRQMATPGDPEVWMADLLKLSIEGAADRPEEQAVLTTALAQLQIGYIDDPRVGPRLLAQAGGLERIVMPGGFAVDAGALGEWLGKVRGRTCLIRAGSTDRGTGELVGPDLVLTNWHVVADVIQDSVVLGNPIGGTVHANTIRLVFDYTTIDGEPADDFEVGLADANTADGSQPWLIDWTQAADAELVENANPPADEPTDQDLLDFALVRIDRALGDERGWFPIAESEFGFAIDAPIAIAGHPVVIEQPGTVYDTKKQARRLVCSIAGQSSLGANRDATRVRYRTNTQSGSSGSPVFNDDFEFVALHHFGRTGSYNQGIPIAAIHRRLAREGKLGYLDA